MDAACDLPLNEVLERCLVNTAIFSNFMQLNRFMPRSSILTTFRLWCISVIVVFLALLPSLSHALIPVPRVKPQAPNASQFLSDKKDITYVVQNLNNWPRMTSIQAKAEGIMFDQPLSARKTVDWFAGREPVVKSVPADLRDDAGLLYERAKWRRRKKTKNYALPVYLQIQKPAVNETGRERVWKEKRIMLRWAIQEKKYDEAYRLTTNHGMSRGASFAEAEFTAGWLALVKLDQPGPPIGRPAPPKP